VARRISGLLWAREGKNPWPKTKRRPRGAKGLGLSYEKALAKALPHAQHGPWFEFCDRNGTGFCSPDIVLVGSDKILVLEAKLTRYEEACAQLEHLYIPVLAHIYRRPVFGAVALKYLQPSTPVDMVCNELKALLSFPSGTFPILHWIGRGPIL
jgi:hypothetical protein